MCWPEADQPWEEFMNAKECFYDDMEMNPDYVMVFDVNEIVQATRWRRMSDGLVVTICIDHRIDIGIRHDFYKENPVIVNALNKVLEDEFNNNEHIKVMRENMLAIKEIMHEDRVIMRLSHPELFK